MNQNKDTYETNYNVKYWDSSGSDSAPADTTEWDRCRFNQNFHLHCKKHFKWR